MREIYASGRTYARGRIITNCYKESKANECSGVRESFTGNAHFVGSCSGAAPMLEMRRAPRCTRLLLPSMPGALHAKMAGKAGRRAQGIPDIRENGSSNKSQGRGMSKAENRRVVQEPSLHSPRHPRNSAEVQRVVEMLARDAMEIERAERVRQNPAMNERPAKRDWYIAINAHDPDSKRRYLAGPGPDHPLTRARHKGKLDARQYEDANAYRILCTAAFQRPAGRDSTQAMMINGGQSSYEPVIDISLGDADAMCELQRINRTLGRESASILLFVCFMEQEIGKAVRWATPEVHPNGVLGRFQEAVNALGRALRKLPPLRTENRGRGEIIHPFQKTA